MISSIFAEFKENGIEFKITDSTNKKKAFNHSTKKDKVNTSPKRMFLPNDEKASGAEKDFAPEIKKGIAQILREYRED